MQDHFMLLELLLPQIILGKAEKVCSLCKNADPWMEVVGQARVSPCQGQLFCDTTVTRWPT